MTQINKILSLLPGFNCGTCGCSDCYGFAKLLDSNKAKTEECPVLLQERFLKKKLSIDKFLAKNHCDGNQSLIGLIDQGKADFLLHPYNGESSCRETLVCFAVHIFEEGQLIRYRPLGCPIIHFGRIIEINNGLLDVWIVGPCSHLGCQETAIDVGICMVLSFQGVIEGVLPKVGKTVKFLPAHCMMGKVHAGIIVQLEDNKTRIDCIDLKIWEHTR